MPIDFQEHRFAFGSATGGPRTQSHRFEFASRVRPGKARALVNGFQIGFTNAEHPLRQVIIDARASVDEEDVDVVATFALRDDSGNFDDRYEGFIDVVVIVDRV